MDSQPADPSVLSIPPQAARPPKPPKAAPKPAMNHTEFASLLRSCLSTEDDVAQDSVTKLKELAKGDAGAARVYALKKQMLAEQQASFVQRMQDEDAQLLEAELFQAWLVDCGGFRCSAIVARASPALVEACPRACQDLFRSRVRLVQPTEGRRHVRRLLAGFRAR